MVIDQIHLYRVAMPLAYPFRTAFGDDDVIESVLVRMESRGLHGWGESTSLKYPAYSPECAASQFLISRDFIAPLLLGRDIETGAALQEALKKIKGNYFAKAGFDLAWWDLYSKTLGKPLWRTLGGVKPTVEAGADFGVMESVKALLDTIQSAVDAGYRRVKLKFRPGWDLDMVRAVRERFPDLVFHIDCNSAYTLDDAPIFEQLDAFALAMIEQPLSHDDLVDHAALQRRLATPICLDESITSLEKARKAIELGACRWVNIKPGRVGGLTNARAIHDFCKNAGVPCWTGGMLESAVGAGHCLAFATLPNNRYPSDIFPSSRFYKTDLGVPPMMHSGPSQFIARDVPGVGFAPDSGMLAEMTLETASVRA